MASPMVCSAQFSPAVRAISSCTVRLREPVAWRSSLAEARNAVAVKAAKETKARTLIRAKLGEENGADFLMS